MRERAAYDRPDYQPMDRSVADQETLGTYFSEQFVDLVRSVALVEAHNASSAQPLERLPGAVDLYVRSGDAVHLARAAYLAMAEYLHPHHQRAILDGRPSRLPVLAPASTDGVREVPTAIRDAEPMLEVPSEEHSVEPEPSPDQETIETPTTNTNPDPVDPIPTPEPEPTPDHEPVVETPEAPEAPAADSPTDESSVEETTQTEEPDPSEPTRPRSSRSRASRARSNDEGH